jgi:predicted glycoside hydrolase/deacetylase ChbG (UPF0249 family)
MEEVERELRAQIRRAREAGLRPSHLDSHQHVHMLPRVALLVARLASENGVRAVRYPRQRRAAVRGRSGTRGLRRRLELAALTSCRRRLSGVHGGGKVGFRFTGGDATQY